MRIWGSVFSLIWLMGSTIQTPALVRTPLRKDGAVLRPPKTYEMRTKIDPITRQPVEYDLKLDIVLTNGRLGLYELRWIGYDGKLKAIVYQSPDRIDVVVTAKATKLPNGSYDYLYTVNSLQTSAEDLSGFAVQSLSNDVVPHGGYGVIVGAMAANPPFKSGTWTRFAPTALSRVGPGQKAEYRITSDGQPGLVECRVHGGQLGLKGTDEEPPYELESVLPGYQPWPHGYTIGPVDSLAKLPKAEAEKYFRDSLPVFESLGWMSRDTSERYASSISTTGLVGLRATAQVDSSNGLVAQEVVDVLVGLLK